MKKLIIPSLVGLALFYSSTTLGYVHLHCGDLNLKWASNSKTLRASTVSFPSGGYWRGGLQEAIDRFNENPSNFNYSLTSDTGGGVGRGNGQSELWFSSDEDVLDCDDDGTGCAPAIAYSSSTCYRWREWTVFGGWSDWEYVGYMDEVDVAFNTDVDWTVSNSTSSLIKYDGSRRSIQATALHEIGHGARFKHEDDEYNIMGSDFEHLHVNSSTARAYLGEDIADGLVHLYGKSQKEDLGVVHWRYEGPSGGYSDHKKTSITSSSGSTLSSVTVDGEKTYKVNAGDTVRIQFTYENNGANTQSGVKVGFYVSTNNLITTRDDRLGGTTMTLGRNSVYTTEHSVSLPSTLTSGEYYWIGAIIDEEDTVSEEVEWNNATRLPIKVN